MATFESDQKKVHSLQNSLCCSSPFSLLAAAACGGLQLMLWMDGGAAGSCGPVSRGVSACVFVAVLQFPQLKDQTHQLNWQISIVRILVCVWLCVSLRWYCNC